MVTQIALMPSAKLVAIIRKIEQKLPGYWYSISQEENNVRISVGPSLYCLVDLDRKWSTTKEGDEGIITDFSPSDILETKTDVLISAITCGVDIWRQNMDNDLIATPRYLGPHRSQSEADLHELRKRYTRMVLELDQFTERGLVISELYLGSCQLSVDCSIRGKDADGKDFDFSRDYMENAIIATALDDSIDEAMSKYRKRGTLSLNL